MSHRLLHDLFRAYDVVGAGIGNDPGSGGTITVDMWGQVFPIVTAAAESRTLAQPSKAGVLAGIFLDTDGGDLTLTVTGGYNEDADTSITFDTASNYIVLWSIKVGSSYYWRVIAQEGTTAAAEGGTFDLITATNGTISSLNVEYTSVSIEAAEHGPGAIGTAGAPQTYRYNREGHIITEIQVDLTGLDSSGVENDVIGLSTGGAAYLGRNVVATNGIIYRVEMICLEVPATGDADIILVQGSAADEEFDDTVANTAVLCDGTGDWVLGETIVNNVPSITANYYYYLTQGGTDNNTYTAGQYLIRFYGHPALLFAL